MNRRDWMSRAVGTLAAIPMLSFLRESESVPDLHAETVAEYGLFPDPVRLTTDQTYPALVPTSDGMLDGLQITVPHGEQAMMLLSAYDHDDTLAIETKDICGACQNVTRWQNMSNPLFAKVEVTKCVCTTHTRRMRVLSYRIYNDHPSIRIGDRISPDVFAGTNLVYEFRLMQVSA